MPVMTSSEALTETLLAYGVDSVFGIIGSAILDPVDLFETAGIRFIGVQHEQAAAHMADGYGRVSGRPGICIAQNGPGVTNLITGVAAAYWAHTPLLCITPEAGSNAQGLGGFQEVEQLPLFEKITRFQAHVARPERLAELVGRCLDYAMVERGPTQVNIPRDVFYNIIDARIPKPRRVADPTAASSDLSRAAELLAGATFPVMLVGGGVIEADAVDEVRALAERLGAPVVTQYLHNDAFQASHPLMCGPIGYLGSKAAMQVLNLADVVMAVGTRLGPFAKAPQYDVDFWPRSAKFIQIDVNHRMLGLTQEVELAIWAGAKETLRLILERLEREPREWHGAATREQRLSQVRGLKDLWARELEEWTNRGPAGELSPRRALRALQRAMPENAIVATDVGNVVSTASSYLTFERPRSYLGAMSWGNCGCAFPTAIGAKVGKPDAPVVAYVGDGAWGMSLGEVLTCVRQQIPVTVVVFNNGQWGAEKRNQMDFYGGRYTASLLENPDFGKVATAMGATGIREEAVDQIGDALLTALGSDRITVIDIPLTRELAPPYRRDALRKPVRKLDKYRALSLADSY
jgi:sulfoacetaldehyde acetyltransferase